VCDVIEMKREGLGRKMRFAFAALQASVFYMMFVWSVCSLNLTYTALGKALTLVQSPAKVVYGADL